MVVEDDPSVAENNITCLEEAGANVVYTDRVDSAISLIRTNTIDLILSDFHLPDGTAADLLAALNNLNVTISVVLLSAEGKKANLQIEGDSLVQEVLTKPVSSSDLQNHISAILAKKKKMREKTPGVISFEERQRILNDITGE